MSFVGVPTRFLDFGAVKINSYPKPVPCTSNAIFCQPTEQTDDIEFQFIASESLELVTNGDFSDSNRWNGWDNTFGWSQPNTENKACCYANQNGLIQTGILAYQGYYKITITITERTTGILLIYSSTGGVSQGTLAMNKDSNGTFTSYFYNGTAGATNLLILGFNDFDGCVDDISVTQITYIDDYTIQILDHETSAVLDTVPVSFLRVTGNVISVQFNWDDLSVTNGCRVIRVLDATKVFEDNFDTDPLLPWTLGADVTISGGDMTYAYSGASCLAPSGFDCGASIDALVVGESYDITYTVQNISGASVTVFAGSTQGTTRSANGTFTETLVCATHTRLAFYFNGAALQTIEIDTISIIHTNNIDGQSECYDLQDSHDCSLLFEWSNSETWGDYDYSTPTTGSAFKQKLRLISKFRGTKYPSTRLIGETSAGVKSMDYSSLRKKKILDIDFAPDYIHDALAAMWMQDTRTIGAVSYILDDDYEPSAPSESRVLFKDMMTARIELEQTTQSNQINRS